MWCDNCKHLIITQNQTETYIHDFYCDKYDEDLGWYDGVMRCDKCLDEYNSAEEIKD